MQFLKLFKSGIILTASFVNFVFSKDVRSQYKGKVVKMIYEYNPYLCNTKNSSSEPPYAWAYEHYKKEQLDEIDGCEGILEFHFVDANINTKVIIYTFVERITSCSTGLPSNFIFLILLG